MIGRRSATAGALVVAVAVAVGALSGCAAKRGAKVESGTRLEYRLAKGVPVTYRSTQIGNQTMEMMGQSMTMETGRTMVFTIVPGETKEASQRLAVRMDSLEASLKAPQGEFTADTGPAIGKTFEMSLSVLGKELDITGADLIQYSLGSVGQRSIKPEFQSMFPDLAGRPLQIGDTWTTTDTVNTDESGMALVIVSQSTNTLAGFEDIGGIRCARITTVGTGTVKGEGTQQGAPVVLEAATEGADTWFFSTELGLLVRMTSELKAGGTVTVGGPGGMKIPTKQQTTTEMVRVK